MRFHSVSLNSPQHNSSLSSMLYNLTVWSATTSNRRLDLRPDCDPHRLIVTSHSGQSPSNCYTQISSRTHTFTWFHVSVWTRTTKKKKEKRKEKAIGGNKSRVKTENADQGFCPKPPCRIRSPAVRERGFPCCLASKS